MATCDSERPEGFTYDPEYNLRSLHTDDSDRWYEAEEPADGTYHPHDEATVHDAEPQNGEPPAYLPKVNTVVPDAAYPASEPGSLHIMTYGTVEDVAFADGENDPQRRNGLVQMSIRDEMDDLIHTDFHTANPLSLLNEQNVQVGKRVRIDIQDYKNVIEWFVYNYPTLLRQSDLTVKRASDGTWYTGGSISKDASYTGKTTGGTGEDWEHKPSGGWRQFDKSFLEVGQMDGNKKITLAEALQIVQDFFHIDDIWGKLRDHEKRIIDLEKDVRSEDTQRSGYNRTSIDRNFFSLLTGHTNWGSVTNPNRGDAVFVGNKEQEYIELNVTYRDSIHTVVEGNISPYLTNVENKLGVDALKILSPGAIPQDFRPTKFHWIYNYGLVYIEPGGWQRLINTLTGIDFGFESDGSVWVPRSQLPWFDMDQPFYGFFNSKENGGHPEYHTWIDHVIDYGITIMSFGGVIPTSTGPSGEW